MDDADIHGTLQGEVFVKQLITIRDGGNVTGNVQYGRLAMELGGNLSAEMRNVPPSIAGDLDRGDRGQSVRITLQDLTALDPDDDAEELTFTVSQAKNGFVTLTSDPGRPGRTFTQADLERGTVLFRHDGTNDAARELRRRRGRPGRRLVGRRADGQRRRAVNGARATLPLERHPGTWCRIQRGRGWSLRSDGSRGHAESMPST